MRALLIASCLAISSCADTTTIESDDVIRLEVCPEGTPCEQVADGRSTVTVRACVPADVLDRKKGLKATLHTSSGRWAAPSDPTRVQDHEVTLDADRCATMALITGTTLDPMRVDASVEGLRASAFIEGLTAATPDGLEVVPSPKLLPSDGGEVGLSVVVRVKKGGQPTVGTKVRFTIVETTPGDAAAFVYPDEVVVEDGKAVGMVALPDAVSELTVRVTATPPAREGETSGPGMTRDVVLRAKGE